MGNSAPLIANGKKCFTEFPCSRRHTIEAERSGDRVEVVRLETIDQIQNILADPRLEVHRIVEAITIT